MRKTESYPDLHGVFCRKNSGCEDGCICLAVYVGVLKYDLDMVPAQEVFCLQEVGDHLRACH